MFSQIFGEFLLNQKYITQEQFTSITEKQKDTRVKMGLIAITEKLMTHEEAEKVNRRQAVEDKRFGDIAVEQGYLTSEQVDNLLRLQGNPFLVFVQALLDCNILSMEEAEKGLGEFQTAYGFTATDIEDFKSGDIDRIIPLFVKCDNEYSKDAASVAVRTMIRLIDDQISIRPAYTTKEYTFKNLAVQSVEGEQNYMLALAGEDRGLLAIAGIFARESFEQMDADSFDSLCEFINCINGLYTSALSERSISADMLPPVFYQNKKISSDKEILVIPVVIQNTQIEIVITADTKMKMIG